MKKVLTGILLCLLLNISTVFANNNAASEPHDVFSHENIRIEAYQHIERLLVSSADAVVAGTVHEGIIIVDGTLTILPGANIGGEIIILGGRLINESGVALKHVPWVVSPGDAPYSGIVIAGLLLLFIAGIAAIPCLVWTALRLLRHFPFAMSIKDWLLAVEHRWPALYIAITLLSSALMLILFAVLAWQTIFRHATAIFDNAFIWLIRYFASPNLDKVMITITNLGFGLTYGVLVLATVVILAIFRRWLELKALIICLVGGAALNEILKQAFERARPESFPIVSALGFSFPSGHAMVSLCFYGILAFLIVRKRSWRWKITGAVVAALLIMAIGVSRIYLGVHYPSDIVAGYAAGATWLGFSISLLMWWEQERAR